MNYIELINRFWQCDIERSFNPSDTRLYFYLLNTCNALNWKQPFGHSDRHLSMILQMSVPTVREAKNRLKQRGLIDFKAPAKASKAYEGQTAYNFPTVQINCTDSLTVNCTVPLTDSLTVPLTNNKLNKTKDKSKENNKKKVFVIPTLEEVTAYCNERKNSVSPSLFLDHYMANGWMRGKTKIRDWKACVRTWENNDKSNQNGRNQTNSSESQSQYGGV